MKKYKKGFTLIELLVVVLIIGVLAAIALPMYQKAVLKSRFAALMPIAKAMADSNEAYYLEHGQYASNPQDLPVQGQADYDDGTSVDLVSDENYTYTISYNENKLPDNNYIIFQKHSMRFSDTTMCEARDEAAGKVCESFGGTPLDGSITSGWTAYLLSGDARGSNFDKECTGTPETEQACSTGCGVSTRDSSCDTRTGEWAYGAWSDSCPAKPEESKQCSNGSGTSGTQTRTVTCNDGTWTTGDWSSCDIPCAGDPPPSLTGYSNVQGTASCVNGQWQYTFSSSVSYKNWGASCLVSQQGTNCRGAKFLSENSRCNANNNLQYGCAGATFSGYNSTCAANSNYGCAYATFSGQWSHCETSNISYHSCSGSLFKSGSYCNVTNHGQGCNDTFYEEGAWCQASGDGKCPAGSPAGDRDSGGAFGNDCWDGNGNHGAEYCL